MLGDVGEKDEEEQRIDDAVVDLDEAAAKDGEQVEAENPEDPPIKVARSPNTPSADELAKHYATHTPYRSWCPVCVKARGKEDAHRRCTKGECGKPIVSADYKSFSHDEDDDKVTTIIVKDETTGLVAAHRCECKGASDAWVVEQVKEDIDAMGHTAIVLKTDGEPAIVQVQQRIQELRAHETIPQHPAAYDPRANGAVERAVQEFMNTMRAMKLSLEQRLQVQMSFEWKAIDWMIEHCAYIMNQ